MSTRRAPPPPASLLPAAIAVIALGGCNEPRQSGGDGEVGGDGATAVQSGGAETAGSGGVEGSGASADADAGSVRLDLADTDLPRVDECAAAPGDTLPPARCDDVAPPDSFAPVPQWVWDGPNGDEQSLVTPLVANLTDDNGDGVVDLCDIPDVVVVATGDPSAPTGGGHIYILNGETGALQTRIETVVEFSSTPAIGDIDGDGRSEIIAVKPRTDDGELVAFDGEGNVKWVGSEYVGALNYGASAALADLDNDGSPEIVFGVLVADAQGQTLWSAPGGVDRRPSSVAADLDGDGDLEVVLGRAVYHHDGSLMWEDTSLRMGFPQVGDLDADGEPEILLTNANGVSLIEADGTVVYSGLTPTGEPTTPMTRWLRPATIHDFDGDGAAEFAVSSANKYAVYEGDGSIVWQADVEDLSGIAAGTAFDFLGDGTAEAMYADELHLFAFDETGTKVFEADRESATIIEYPVVADIDNDRSAEILVVSNRRQGNPSMGDVHTLQALRDNEDRWVPARRIWNQHTYHVTNVEEDGAIPQFERPHWADLNTFRTNAQVENGRTCQPPQQG